MPLGVARQRWAMTARNALSADSASPAPASGTRQVWLDFLRLAAGVSMVGLHASSDPSGQPFVDYAPGDRVFPVLFRAVVYMARTELFLMISLFLLVMALERRPRSYPVMLREQARRLLLPFAFWVVVYAFFRLIKASHFGYADAIWAELATPSAWLGYFVLGDVIFHMHFLPTLFGLVLMAPLYVHAARHPWTGLIVVLCLFAKREADLWLWSHYAQIPAADYVLRAVKILTYAGYGIAAGALYGLWRDGRVRAATEGALPLLLFAGGMLFSVKLVYSAKVITAGNWQWNYTPGFWADFLMPVVLFALAMAAANRHWPPVISRLAPYSFGLYLAHPLFLGQVEIAVDLLQLAPWAQVMLKFSITLVLTSAFVWGLARIPLLAWTIGLGPLPFAPRNNLSTPTPHRS